MNMPLNKQALADQAATSAPPPSRAGQATMVEQSRAVAEVQGAIVLAQRCPRDITRAISEMRQSCGIKEMADSAFFRFPRGGTHITGPSVQLARELARCWGNIDYGVKEMARDDGHGQSEMLAFAWDLETNVRAETVFIVPHLRDKKGGPERLTDVRDIYEVNANMGARRLREQIFAVLPRWFTEQAESACHETLQGGGGEPLPLRITKMVEAFGALGVTKVQIERRIGCAVDKIDPVALANLTITYKSIKRGEVAKADEFPEDKAATLEAGLKAASIADTTGKKKDSPRPQPAETAKDDGLSPAASTALAALTASTTEAALDDLWEHADIEVCREIGADRLEEIRARLIHNQATAAGQKDLLP